MEFNTIIVTFVGALFFGLILIIISKSINISSIVLLLIGGIILGPHAFGINLINPETLGEGLEVIIKLSVALILFEGGLTLDANGFRSVSSEIRRALTIGVIVTALLTAIGVYVIFDFPPIFSLLCGSLVIVTGPTVIGPLLKRLNVNDKIHNFLHWEGILIDPIGVFIALLVYEYIIGHDALILFFIRIATGLGIGIASGFFLSYIIRKHWVPEDHLNVFLLAYILGIYVVSDLIVVESGLMSAVVAGFFIDYYKTPEIYSIRVYKAELIDLLIGLLFILLAANLDLNAFVKYYNWQMLAIVIGIMFIIRPVNIFLSTIGKNFSFRERVFLSWIAPRGIVAASMASLFALNLKELNFPSNQYEFIEAFTYVVIGSTVILQGFTAKPLGRLLKIIQPAPTGWLIVGINKPSLIMAEIINSLGYTVALIDTNLHSVRIARRKGLYAISENALSIDPDDYPDLHRIGNVIAVTANEDLNELVCQRWKKLLNKPALYQWKYTDPAGKLNEIDTTTGTRVWTSLKLNIISNINSKELSFPVFKKEDLNKKPIRHPERVLFYASKKRLLPYLPTDPENSCTCMAYSPFDIKTDINIRSQWVLYTEADSLSEIFGEMLKQFQKDFPNTNTDQLMERLIAQEQEYSSAIGYDTALTHTYLDNIETSVVLIAKNASAVSCSYNNECIENIIMVLSPKDQPDTHIETLSKISKFIKNEENRRALKNVKSRSELMNVFFPDE